MGTMTFKLGPCEVSSFHYTREYPGYEGDRNEMGSVAIEFKDSIEIEAFIDMLRVFKENCIKAAGTWKTTKEAEE